MQNNFNEAELIFRAKLGDHSAFTEIYERYAAAIYRYIFFRVGQAELAEDLQSDVFLRAFEDLHRYEDRGWPFSAWLYRIARDRTIDTVRRQRRRQHIPIENWDGWYDGPESEIDTHSDKDKIHQLMRELTIEQQQVLHLRFTADLSIQEVANRLGRSEGSVKALQHRGLQSLARHFDPATMQ